MSVIADRDAAASDARRRLDESARRYVSLDERAAKARPAERRALRREADKALAEMRRAWLALNEHEHPAGPDLATWTVERLRSADSRPDPDTGLAFWADIERLRMGDRNALETTIRFLEADPWWIGSGYEKERILRYLRRVDVSGYESRITAAVIRGIADQHDRRELREYARTARHFMTPHLHQELERLAAGEGKAREHACWVLRNL
jgi:hypothetical protein